MIVCVCACACVCVCVCESVVRMLQESRKEDRPDGECLCTLWSTHVASLPFAHESNGNTPKLHYCPEQLNFTVAWKDSLPRQSKKVSSVR